MKRNEKYLLFGGLTLLLILLSKMARSAWYTITDWLIPEFEGFRSNPYADYSQYSWGYGTRAPGPTGTITKEQALIDMRAHLQNDYGILYPLISRKLNAHQWAALLSFSYNLGPVNAKNLIPNINSGNDVALETQWKKYVNAGGVVNTALVARRNTEWNVWQGSF